MNYKRFALGALWTNGYLFYDEDSRESFFVDPGGNMEEVINYLNRNNLNLKAVLLTHGHIDHIAGIPEIENLVKNNIYVGHGDAYMLRHPQKELQALLNVHCEEVKDFQEIFDGQILNIANYEIKIYETPGHTEGGICYLITDRAGHNILISGDTLFAQSVGRTDLPGGDYLKLDNSLKLLSKFPDGLRVLPGHGPETSIGAERELNPYWPRG